jgi:hypothetical protein
MPARSYKGSFFNPLRLRASAVSLSLPVGNEPRTCKTGPRYTRHLSLATLLTQLHRHQHE